MSLEGGRHAAKQINAILDGRTRPSKAVSAHKAWIKRYRGVFMGLISMVFFCMVMVVVTVDIASHLKDE